MKILHLEDNVSDSILIERTLQRHGIEVELLCARSGDEFRRALDSGAFDVVLVDNGVPGFSGKAALQYAKGSNDRIPVIFCSGAARDEEVATRLREGASDYVLKDHLWQLVAALRRVETVHVHDPAVARLTRELESANQELEAFSYAVSHDLRAPLRGMSSQLEMLADSMLAGETAEPLARIDAARTHVRQMAALIDDLMRLSRISRVDMRVERFDLSMLASEIAGRLRAQEPERQVALRIECDLEADGDRALLGIVLENLLGNAWKFTSLQPQAAIEFGAIAGVGAHAGRRTYFVRDNGAGFDSHYADKLFQPFQRLHRLDEFPGAGVGLATVQRIVKRHEGEIWAESTLGEGATFFFTLATA